MNSLFLPSDDLELFVSFDAPPRSRLFTLTPQGIGTRDQESLVSLSVRTCHAPAVNPRRMIAEIFPSAEPQIARLATAPFFGKLSATINGLGQYAELFASAMEKLAGHENLRALTMLPWQGLFPHNGQGLLARQRRWCPTCLKSKWNYPSRRRVNLLLRKESMSLAQSHLNQALALLLKRIHERKTAI